MRALLLLPFVLSTLLLMPARGGEFEVRDGDRVVLIGDAFIERDQESGWLETVMNASFPNHHIIVRNLGWSGDTPTGQSRLSFDFNDPNKGLQLLRDAAAKAEPTVIVLGYGMANSLDENADTSKFADDMERLITALQQDSKRPLRFVILSPLRHEKLPPPLPDPVFHNYRLSRYAGLLREIAAKHHFPFVDLFDWKPSKPAREVTDNGIHLTPAGYELMALEVARQLGWQPQIKPAGKEIVESLRQEIVRKDQLYFDRWRPENQTYLLGFRQHEQGKNAKEIPEFDPLIEVADQRIFQWKQLLTKESSAKPAPLPAGIPAKGSNAPALPTFDVAPGFEVSLWASSPLLMKPTQMNFDPHGRLWIAESSIYPQIAPGQKANDKIVVLEDTQHLGRADKSTVFVDGLFLPTAVEPGDGGCYVGQSTELLFFPGKEKATDRRVVLSGFGTEDTHHLVHTLAWGPDGMLYFDQSIYIHSHLETPNGIVRLNSGGVLHLQPRSMQLDVFLRGFCNPWGHQFDTFGQSFVTDGAGGQGISWGIEGATYFTYASMRRELASISPGSYPKFCGLEIVASQQFPADWQGSMITADFRAHRLVRFSINDDGAGYVTTQMPDVLRTTNDSFRPIDMKFGPDGALYVADWCNPIINHGEVDFRDPRRDHDHGRIWRITAKGRPLEAYRDFTKLENRRLLDSLLSSNVYDVEQSRRVLTERGMRILPDLKKWTARHSDEKALLESLWMHQAISAQDDSLLDRVLAAGDGRIRAAGARVLSAWPRSTASAYSGEAEPDAVYQRLLNDPFPRVRVEALRALAKIPSTRSAQWALGMVDQKLDSFQDYALWLTINDLAKPWVRGVRQRLLTGAKNEKQLAYGLRAIDGEIAAPLLAELLKYRTAGINGKGPWIELIGQIGAPAEVQMLFDSMLHNAGALPEWNAMQKEKPGGMADVDQLTPEEVEDALSHLFDRKPAPDLQQQWPPEVNRRAWAAVTAAADRGVNPSQHTEKLATLFHTGDESTRIDAIRLAGDWKVSDCFSNLCAIPTEPDVPASVRTAVFDALRKIGGPQVIATLQPWAAPGQPMELRKPAVLTLAAIDLQNSGPIALALLKDLPDSQTQVSVWRALLRNSGAAGVLSTALPKSGFPAELAKSGIRAVHEGLNEPDLVVALTRAAGLQGGDAELNKLEIMRLAENVLNHGDPARGERLFRSQQQSCATCHAIGGVGGHVGPDLTSIGASAQPDYLIESVYYPNKEIKDGYQSVQVTTHDGEDTAGILVRENDHELVLRNAADQLVTIAKTQIATRKQGGSLMPSGLTDNLTMPQQLDLFAFLAQLGKPGPFDASAGNVARFWRVGAFADGASLHDTNMLAGDQWHNVASQVDGRLLRDDIQAKVQGGSLICAGAKFRTAKDGTVHLDVPSGAKVILDGAETPERDSKVAAQLASGTHTIVLEFDAAKLPESVRVQTQDGTFLTN